MIARDRLPRSPKTRRSSRVWFALVIGLAFVLAMTPVAIARFDPYGGVTPSDANPFAPYTAEEGEPYAPYEAGPVIHESDLYVPYTAVEGEPYAPYEAGPVVREEGLYAPYEAGPVVH